MTAAEAAERWKISPVTVKQALWSKEQLPRLLQNDAERLKEHG